MSVFENIERIAHQKGKTVRAVSIAAGLSDDTVAKWKNGNPSLKNLSKVAKVLGVSVTDLVEE
ncbi:MAG: helix-turn-helix transcriptional regulator [Mogibacterium sp.]|nr:helix-turn-helix transcriptional regulator [Mogibacterium sp.]